jgi:hypothetical protein
MRFLFCFLPIPGAAYVACWCGDLKVFVAFRPRKIIAQFGGLGAWVFSVAFVTLWSSRDGMTIGSVK